MTNDEICNLAVEHDAMSGDVGDLLMFARAIEIRARLAAIGQWFQEGAKVEREACAKECESARPTTRSFDSRFYDACNLCALFIRNRGNDEWREEVENAMQNIEKRWNDPPKPFFEEFDE